MKFKLLQKKERWSGGGWTEPVHLVLFECQHKYFSVCNMLTLISRLITCFFCMLAQFILHIGEIIMSPYQMNENTGI